MPYNTTKLNQNLVHQHSLDSHTFVVFALLDYISNQQQFCKSYGKLLDDGRSYWSRFLQKIFMHHQVPF